MLLNKVTYLTIFKSLTLSLSSYIFGFEKFLVTFWGQKTLVRTFWGNFLGYVLYGGLFYVQVAMGNLC